MARPSKQGVDYFPLDVNMSDSVRLVEAEFGLTGFAVIIKLYQRIYGGAGYYCRWTEEVALLFASDLKLGGNVVSEIVAACIKRGIFDRSMLDRFGILTSQGIQSRYLKMVKRRDGFEIDPQYALVSYSQNEVSVNNNAVFARKNSENVCKNPQSKVNESKVNESKESVAPMHTRGELLPLGKFANVQLSEDEYKKLEQLIPDFSNYLERFSARIAAKGYHYDNHYAALCAWYADDKKAEPNSSFNIDEFWQAALNNTYEGVTQ